MKEGYKVDQPDDFDVNTHVAATISNCNGTNDVIILCWFAYDESVERSLSKNLTAVFKIRPRIPMPKP